MASGLFTRSTLLLTTLTGTAVGCACYTTTAALAHQHQQQYMQSWAFNPFIYRLDSPSFKPNPKDSAPFSSSSTKPTNFLSRTSIKQLSAGSLLGLAAGLAVSTFSKPLALLIGLLVVGGQLCESYLGIQPLPYGKIQKFLRKKVDSGGVDVRGAMRQNVAFKLAFGAVFALSAFAEF